MHELPQAIPTKDELDWGAKQGLNSLNTIGYTGPCPPPEKTHRYVFTLYALDKALDLPAGKITQPDLLKAMQGHIVKSAQLIGLFKKTEHDTCNGTCWD